MYFLSRDSPRRLGERLGHSTTSTPEASGRGAAIVAKSFESEYFMSPNATWFVALVIQRTHKRRINISPGGARWLKRTAEQSQAADNRRRIYAAGGRESFGKYTTLIAVGPESIKFGRVLWIAGNIAPGQRGSVIRWVLLSYTNYDRQQSNRIIQMSFARDFANFITYHVERFLRAKYTKSKHIMLNRSIELHYYCTFV